MDNIVVEEMNFKSQNVFTASHTKIMMQNITIRIETHPLLNKTRCFGISNSDCHAVYYLMCFSCPVVYP